MQQSGAGDSMQQSGAGDSMQQSAQWESAYQPSRGEPMQRKVRIPVTATMDRQIDAPLALQADLSFLFLDQVGGPEDDVGQGINASAQRLDLYAQYLMPLPSVKLGVYVAAPISRIAVDDASNSSLGNIDVGGIIVPRAAFPLTLRAGVILPTGENLVDANGGTARGRNAAVLATVGRRLTDAATLFPGITWIRLSGSAGLINTNRFFARADVGLDAPIMEGQEAHEDFQINGLVRANVAAGVFAGPAAITVEFANLGVLGEDQDLNFNQELMHTLGVTAGFSMKNLQPYLSAIFSLDEETRQDVSGVFSVGLRATL